MAFIESPRFPEFISYGSSGGPSYSTDVITVKSGYETRNSNWIQSRSNYDAAFGIKVQKDIDTIVNFFHAMKGKANEFRFKDWGDYKSCPLDDTPSAIDQFIGIGDSTDGIDGVTDFQIIKSYTSGRTTEREIYKPVVDSLVVAVEGIGSVEGTDYDIDYTTGIISFKSGSVPLLDRGDGQPETITAGYEFDVPCRFDSDQLTINFEAYLVGSASIPVIEVRINV